MKKLPFPPLLLIVTWLALTAASNSQAICPTNLGRAPEIHSGANMNKTTMLELQGEVKLYVKQGEEILACTGSDLRHNAILHQIKKVADSYNSKLQTFNTTLATL